MKKIIYTRSDGGISVVSPVINKFGEPDNFTEADAEKRALDKLPAGAINPRFVSADEVPADRTFRNAWEDVGKIQVNMPKAREIHKDHLRQLRAPLLAALDIEYQRADEQNNTALKTQIAAEKQALRDATKHPAIAAAKTPDELKVAIPNALKLA